MAFSGDTAGNAAGDNTDIAVNATLVSPALNLLRWHIEFDLLRGSAGEYTVSLHGALAPGKDQGCPHILKPLEGGILCVFTTGDPVSALIRDN
jgi:hypothetical protein